MATDRISAFDVVMDEPIPDKGRILTQLSAFWFRHLADYPQPPHFPQPGISPGLPALPGPAPGRTMLVRKS